MNHQQTQVHLGDLEEELLIPQNLLQDQVIHLQLVHHKVTQVLVDNLFLLMEDQQVEGPVAQDLAVMLVMVVQLPLHQLQVLQLVTPQVEGLVLLQVEIVALQIEDKVAEAVEAILEVILGEAPVL
jgi:hypothetical protein